MNLFDTMARLICSRQLLFILVKLFNICIAWSNAVSSNKKGNLAKKYEKFHQLSRAQMIWSYDLVINFSQ